MKISFFIAPSAKPLVKFDILASSPWPVFCSVTFDQYGRDYFSGLAANLKAVLRFRPDWIVRLYFRTGSASRRRDLCRLACRYPALDLCDVETIPKLGEQYFFSGQCLHANKQTEKEAFVFIQRIHFCTSLYNASVVKIFNETNSLARF
jgi:hypothetical protein